LPPTGNLFWSLAFVAAENFAPSSWYLAADPVDVLRWDNECAGGIDRRPPIQGRSPIRKDNRRSDGDRGRLQGQERTKRQ
jgi:hypothetical protein